MNPLPPAYEDHDLSCRDCGHIQSVRLWQRVHAQRNPEARALLFQGLLNVLVCENCNQPASFPVPLGYRDDRLAFGVLFFPGEAVDDPDFYQAFAGNGMLRLPPQANVAPAVPATAHVVFSISELVTYIVFRERLAAHQVHPQTLGDGGVAQDQLRLGSLDFQLLARTADEQS